MGFKKNYKYNKFKYSEVLPTIYLKLQNAAIEEVLNSVKGIVSNHKPKCWSTAPNACGPLKDQGLILHS